MPAAPASTAELFDLLQKSGIAPPDRVAAAVPDPATLPAEPQKAAGVLVQKGVLTKFQAQQLLQGRYKGFRVGPYAVLDLLGRGGMGAVYLAEHLELRRKVAIKVLIPGKDDDQRLATERFLREARAAAALDHPNIVRIFDVARHHDTPYLVMEYVDGETLQQVLDRDGPMPYSTAADAVAQAAAGLQHAHEKGFVHRDIKPGNLMRDRSGTVKLLDMGLARSFNCDQDKLTEKLDAGAVVGTADFISPEQALNQPHIDIRADIYSLGATFFALIAGKPPFEGNTTQKLLHHQLSSAPNLTKIDSTLPKGLGTVVGKMLAKKPEDRYQTPAEVIAALAPWLGNSTRVLAGISRTNLGQGAELHAALNDRARGSSRRLRTAGPDGEDGAVSLEQSEKETGEVASSKTTRSPGPSAPLPKPKKKRKARAEEPDEQKKKVLIYAGVGAAVLAAGALAGFLAFGGGKSADTQANTNQPQQPPPDAAKGPTPPGANPPRNGGTVPPVTRPKDPPAPVIGGGGERLVYRLDLSKQKPFRLRGGHEATNVPGRDVRFVLTDKAGDGDWPDGWSGMPWDQGSEAEYTAEVRDGRTVLGMKNLSKRSAMMLSPDVTVPSRHCRVRFEYLTDAEFAKAALLKFKGANQPNNVGLKELLPLDGTGGQWKPVDLEVDLKFATGFFEFHAFDDDPGRGFYLRAFEVTEPGAGPAPAAGAANEPVRFRLDLAGQKPFAIRSGLEAKPDGRKDYKPLSQTGPGEPPAGWVGRCWNGETQMEFLAEDNRGTTALGIRNVRGPGSAMLFMPHFDCPGGTCRVRFEYAAAVRDGRFTLRFKPAGDRPAWTVSNPPATGGEWRTEEQVVDLKGAAGGFFEFHNTDERPTAALWLRALTVSEVAAGSKASAAPPEPAPVSGLAAWREGAVLYRLEVEKVAPFRVTKEGFDRGQGERLPSGVVCGCWKSGAVGEFRRETLDGVPALGVTNLSDAMSGQFAFELERELKVDLKPGRAYRVKLGYSTKNDARGSFTVQTTAYKAVEHVELPGTGGLWRSAALSFTRPEDISVRLTIDNGTVGEGNTLYVRSVELVELIDPAKGN